MRKIVIMLFAIGFFTVPAFAQKITIDYAKAFDFDKVKTFVYTPTPDTNAKDPLMDDRIKEAVLNKLKAGGLTEVEADPDIYVTYHVTTKDNTVYDTMSMGYGGYGMGWGGWGMGMGSSTTVSTTYTDGSLIVDAYDSTEKKLVWRAVGTVTLKDDPAKVTKQIQKVIDKMGQKWAQILKKKGK